MVSKEFRKQRTFFLMPPPLPPSIFTAQIKHKGKTSRQHYKEKGSEVPVGGADTTVSGFCRLDFKANNFSCQLIPLLHHLLILKIIVLLLWGLRAVAMYQGDTVLSSLYTGNKKTIYSILFLHWFMQTH